MSKQENNQKVEPLVLSSVREQVEHYFDREFSFMDFDIIKELDECWFENIQNPSFEIQAKEWMDSYSNEEEMYQEYKEETDLNPLENYPDFLKWLERNKGDEIYDNFMESEHSPMWSTLFVAKNSFMQEWIVENVDKLYDIGIGVYDNHEKDITALFIGGAGYDFYDAHWTPLFTKLLKWVN